MPFRRNDKWIGQVRKEKKRKEKVFFTKKEALAWEAKMRRKPVEDWREKTDTTCLGDWAQAYLDYAESKFAEKTYMEKRLTFQKLFQAVDPALPVRQLIPATVLKHIQAQKEERTGNAANKDRKNLVAAWNWGIRYMEPTLPRENPCQVEKMPEVRHPRYVPSEEDFWRAFERAPTKQDRVMLLSALHLAARRGEIFRLRLSDLDWEHQRVRLWTKKRQDSTWEYDWLPMTDELAEAIQSWLDIRPVDSEHVFVCLDDYAYCRPYYGKPFRNRAHFMSRLCEAAQVKPFGFHSIRHLSASILYSLGYDVATIQAVLRHKNPNTTARYLKSLGYEDVRAAVQSLSMRRGQEPSPEGGNEGVSGRSDREKPSGEPSTPQTARPHLRLVSKGL